MSASALHNTTVRVEEVTRASDDVVDALGRLARGLPRYQEPPSVEHVEAIANSPSTRLLVARDGDDRIVGTMTLALYPLPTGVRAWLEDVVVARSGQGIGRRLTEEALRIARESGARDAELIVRPSETGGLKMAALMGFGPNDEDTRRIRL
jgi:ribosomal protein S18 acetylase RimI-like enzyme